MAVLFKHTEIGKKYDGARRIEAEFSILDDVPVCRQLYPAVVRRSTHPETTARTAAAMGAGPSGINRDSANP